MAHYKITVSFRQGVYNPCDRDEIGLENRCSFFLHRISFSNNAIVYIVVDSHFFRLETSHYLSTGSGGVCGGHFVFRENGERISHH